MSDEALATMARQVTQMHQNAIVVWGLAHMTMPRQGQQYRDICAMGRKVEGVYKALRLEAAERRWSEERIHEVFGSHTHCTFS